MAAVKSPIMSDMQTPYGQTCGAGQAPTAKVTLVE